ncbi:MAG: zinc ribbon domain-containing protein [Eubacteriales bacterium]|nr:zinc ribbon domain-containing protein [Eubacteriales bacterium]
MFLMIGVTQGRKDFDHNQLVICTQCGQYGRYRVYMTFTQLLLFFIPCFRWGRKYYVQMSCCGTVYELNPEIGARIARGESVEIGAADLRFAGRSGGGAARRVRRCPACGYQTEEDFSFCPKCGGHLE